MMQQSECPPIAIVSIDLTGYSRLMELDEAGTHHTMMKCHREILRPTIELHGGKIVKSTGDGALIVFPGASDAVHGMIEFQGRMTRWTRPQPIDKRLEYRVGIHVAAAIVEEDDVYGNGVNLAVRLQEASDPGSVLVSQSVVDNIGEKSNYLFKYLGRERLKNISKPIPLYQWQNGRVKRSLSQHLQRLVAAAIGLAVLSYPLGSFYEDERVRSSPTKQARPSSEHQTQIAVLPFADRASDSGLEDLIEKLPNAIAANLAKNPSLFVLNQPHAMEPGQQDGYLLEGAIENNADRVRVSIQLRDSQAGASVWGDNFDSSSTDTSALEHNVARRVASSIAMTMRLGERIVQSRSENAYNAYLRAITYYDRNTPSGLGQAVANLKEALTWDPGYSRAHALLAATYWTGWQNRWRIDPSKTAETTLASAEIHLKQATDDPSAIAHSVVSEMLTNGGRHAQAIVEAERAIILEPDASFGYYAKGLALVFDGRPNEAESFIQRAIRLNPHGQRYLAGLGLAEYGMQRFHNAVKTLTHATTRNSQDDWSFLLLAATYGQLRWADRAGAAIASFDTLSMQRRGWSSDHLPYVLTWPFRYDLDRQRLHEGMILAGVKSQFRVAIRQ